jgi:MraZ protein
VVQNPLRKPFFFGEHELTIDIKNRLLIPSQIRKNLDVKLDGTSFFVILKETVPWFYPYGYFKELTDMQVEPDLSPSEPHQMFTHLMVSMAAELEWDNQGRVLLTPNIISRAKIGNDDREVTLIGAKDHLELWKRDKWKERSNLVMAQSPQIGEWWQKTLQKPGPTTSKEPAK